MTGKPHPTIGAVIAVGSGKGGVGKSTVSLNLALALAENSARVGLLDADIYGPNIPLMVGIVREEWRKHWTLARGGSPNKVPAVQRFGLRIVSAGFILGDEQPLADSSLARMVASQLLWQTEWGELEYLVIDFPPGTGVVHQTLLGSANIAGAILVVTPQDVAHQDARKALQTFKRAGIRVLGGVENMSAFACPDCGRRIDLFPRVAETRSLWAAGVDRLGEIPLDPSISEAGDSGRRSWAALSERNAGEIGMGLYGPSVLLCALRTTEPLCYPGIAEAIAMTFPHLPAGVTLWRLRPPRQKPRLRGMHAPLASFLSRVSPVPRRELSGSRPRGCSRSLAGARG